MIYFKNKSRMLVTVVFLTTIFVLSYLFLIDDLSVLLPAMVFPGGLLLLIEIETQDYIVWDGNIITVKNPYKPWIDYQIKLDSIAKVELLDSKPGHVISIKTNNNHYKIGCCARIEEYEVFFNKLESVGINVDFLIVDNIEQYRRMFKKEKK